MYKILLILLSVLLIVIGIFYGPKIARLYHLANLYNEDSIDRNFINIDKIFSVSEPIPASDNPYTFPGEILFCQKLSFLMVSKDFFLKN